MPIEDYTYTCVICLKRYRSEDLLNLHRRETHKFVRPVGEEKSNGERLINERHHTHGDWRHTSSFIQAAKHLMRCGPRWNDLSDSEREALDSIAMKISRILCGESNTQHWEDIEGYAALGRGVRSDATESH